MKNTTLILSLLLLCSLAATAQTLQSPDSLAADKKPQADNRITGNVEMNYLEHYVWRGMLVGGNDVAQPELNLKWRKFSLGLIANLNYNPSALHKENDEKSTVYDEQDVQIGYSTSFKKFDFECKAIGYFLINQAGAANTAELYNKTAYNINDKLSFFTENSVDILNYGGAYYNNTGICYSRSFDNKVSIELTGYASSGNKKFNAAYFDTEAGSFNLVGSSIEVSKDFGPLYISVFGEINNYTNKAVKESTGLKSTDNFIIAVGWNF